jgi:hypothetical protein
MQNKTNKNRQVKASVLAARTSRLKKESTKKKKKKRRRVQGRAERIVSNKNHTKKSHLVLRNRPNFATVSLGRGWYILSDK